MPKRLRRTVRGLEKMIEPLRYHFDDLEKQVQRRPAGIDLTATVEILHKNLARIEQELAFMRERVDMELLLQNDSLSEEDLPLPGDTPAPGGYSNHRNSRDSRDAPDSREPSPISSSGIPRAFSATGNPFELPATSADAATRTDDRSADETMLLRPVNLNSQSSDSQPLIDPSAYETRVDLHSDETIVLQRNKPKK